MALPFSSVATKTRFPASKVGEFDHHLALQVIARYCIGGLAASTARSIVHDCLRVVVSGRAEPQ